jgi:hypothetical protein
MRRERGELVVYAFDLPHRDGRDLRPLRARTAVDPIGQQDVGVGEGPAEPGQVALAAASSPFSRAQSTQEADQRWRTTGKLSALCT